MSRRLQVILAAVALALVVSVAAAWVFETQIFPSPQSGAPDEYRVRITRQGEELASFNIEQLKALGVKRVVLQTGVEEGPALADVLASAGVERYASLVILGMGQRDTGRLELSAADVGPDTVLDIAKRGTVKVAGPEIARDERVRDITEIQVK